MPVKVAKNKYLDIRKASISVWDEFVYGGHFLALGDAVALYVMAVVLNISVTWDFLVVIYLCVFAANLFNRSDESGHDALTNPVRVKVMDKYVRYFYPITAICLAISVLLILSYSNYAALLFAVLIFVIATLYTLLFKKMTKYVIGFKSFVAAFFYALMVFFLTIYYSVPVGAAAILMFAFYFIRIFISNAACDVKDIEGDKKRELKTFAIRMGENGAMRFLNILNIASGLLIIWGVYANVLPVFSLALLLTVPYAIYYLYLNSKMNSKEMYTNAIVDGEFLLWLPFLLIGKVLF
ncbi:MAG: UbiA family prenyltransferase [Candidatus Saccharibacteria bacterium]|nr:UbiA family prenyltransferase [Candidatus Saccharibacteria bacterium]